MKPLQYRPAGLQLVVAASFFLLPLTACEPKKGVNRGPGPATATATDPAITPPRPSETACLKLQSENVPQDDTEVPNDAQGDLAKTDTGTSTSTTAGTGGQCQGSPVPSTENNGSPAGTEGNGDASQNGTTGAGAGAGTGTSNPGSTPPAPNPGTGAPGSTYSTWTPGPGISSCYDQGKVWVAVSSSTPGKSGTCGESLANFCCTQSAVIGKFPRYQTSLEPKFADYSSKGFTLYGCSTDGNRKTTFHFVNAPQAGSVSYATFWIEEPSQAGVPPASCPQVTLESLRIGTGATPSAAAGGSSSGVPAPTGTGTGPYGP